MSRDTTTAVFALPFLLIYIGIFVLYVWSIVWSYGDAQARGKPGCLVALLVALFSWPLSLLLWIIFRPEHQYPRY